MKADGHSGTRVYWNVFWALLGLLLITIGVAYLHLGHVGVILAMVIALIKAWLVAYYFMHVNKSPPWFGFFH